MDKYLFLFYDLELQIINWYEFDPKEPVSDAMAVQEAFNRMLQIEDCCSCSIYQDPILFKSSGQSLFVASIRL